MKRIKRERGLVLFSALIMSSYPQLSARKKYYFQLKVCRLNIRDVRGGGF